MHVEQTTLLELVESNKVELRFELEELAATLLGIDAQVGVRSLVVFGRVFYQVHFAGLEAMITDLRDYTRLSQWEGLMHVEETAIHGWVESIRSELQSGIEQLAAQIGSHQQFVRKFSLDQTGCSTKSSLPIWRRQSLTRKVMPIICQVRRRNKVEDFQISITGYTLSPC